MSPVCLVLLVPMVVVVAVVVNTAMRAMERSSSSPVFVINVNIKDRLLVYQHFWLYVDVVKQP